MVEITDPRPDCVQIRDRHQDRTGQGGYLICDPVLSCPVTTAGKAPGQGRTNVPALILSINVIDSFMLYSFD